MPSPIFDAPLTSTLVPTTAGNPAFTFTRATTAYVADQDNILRQAVANEARFQGARRVRNRIQGSSENLTVPGGWIISAVTSAIGATDPLGGSTAWTVTATAPSSFIYNQYPGGWAVGELGVNSAWIRRRTGTGPIAFRTPNNVDVDITSQLTSSWQRFSVPGTPLATTTGYLMFFITTSGDAIDVWHPQSEVVGGASNQAPGDYVSVGVLAAPYHGNAVDGVKYFATTNGNSVAGNVVTEATGTLIPAASLLGYVAENAATNLCLQSQTFNVTWTVNALVGTPDIQTAPDGTLTADRFADDVTNAFHRIYQSFAVANATVYTYSLYVKAGTLTWMQMSLVTATQRWANFNLVTGAIGNKAAGTTATITALPNGWYRCSVTATSDSATAFAMAYSLNSDAASTDFAYIGTGQTMYLWGAQMEAGEMSSYIPTTTAAVVRNTDLDPYQAAGNISDVIGSAYAENYLPAAFAGLSQQSVMWATPANQLGYDPTTKGLRCDGATGALTANAPVIGAVNKVAVAWSGATSSASLNGGTVATGAYVGNASTTFVVGGSGANSVRGTVRNLKIYATRLTDAQLIDLTEDGVLTPDPEPPSTAAGHGGTAARYRRRRIEVEIDGEIFPVASEEEGRELLLKAREAAKQAAQAAAVRAAAKAEKKTSPAAVERALALSTPRISLRADDRSEALAQAIQSQVDAAQAAIDEDYATARRMAYAYVRQRLQDEQRQRELAADEEEVIAMILRLP